MAIKVFDTKDAVPEAQRDAAVEVGGKFVVEESSGAADTTGLKTALEKERADRKAAEKAKRDADAELERLRLEAKAAEGKVSEQAHKELREEYEKKVRAEKERADAAEAKQRKDTKEHLLDRYLLAAGVMQDRLEKARKDVADRVDLNDAGDDLILQGKWGTEKPTEFFSTTYKAEAPFFYAGTGTSGSGASGSTAGGAGSSDATARAAAKGKEMAAQQKATAEKNSLAFQ